MVRVRIALVAGVCGAAALGLAACDNGPSALRRQDTQAQTPSGEALYIPIESPESSDRLI